MKFRTQIFWAIGLATLLLAIAIYTFSPRDQEPAQVFPATINRDCAPWDGSAFTVSIPYNPGAFINISIWQSPDIPLPMTFSFPEETLMVGSATYFPRFSYSIPLTGKVYFRHVDSENPVEGEFDFLTETGQRLEGKFIAEWGNEIVYCG